MRPWNINIRALESVQHLSDLLLLLAGRRTLRNVVSQDDTTFYIGNVLWIADAAELVPASFFTHAADATEGLLVGSLVRQLLGEQEGEAGGRCPVIEAAHQSFLRHNEEALLIIFVKLVSRDAVLLHDDVGAAIPGNSDHIILVAIVAVNEPCLALALREILLVVFHDDYVGIVSLVDHPSDEQPESEMLQEILILRRIQLRSCGSEAYDVHSFWQLAVAIEEEIIGLVDDVDSAVFSIACLD